MASSISGACVKGVLNKAAMFLLVAVLVLAMFLAWFNQMAFGSGFTVRQAAFILVNDDKLGMRAKKKAIAYGDEILPYIVKQSNDFAKLNNRNAYWIADVLGCIKTEQSRKILRDLYSRKAPFQRLVGAIGLAWQGALPEPISESSWLVQMARTDPKEDNVDLAIIALGHSKSPAALPCLLELLSKRQRGGYYACEALARIRSASAIPALRDCLRSKDFYALPEAFRALIALGDKEAVPLAIARVAPEIKGYNSGFLVYELKLVTGQQHGFDRAAWEKWWASAKATWKIPKEFQKPFDEQPKAHFPNLFGF
jgi:hypothetical protein